MELSSFFTEEDSSNTKQAELIWKNITLKTEKKKVLLNGVDGKIEPGTMVALMGSSGAGKTTLLNSLTGRIPSNLNLTGEILVNGRPRTNESWSNTSAYVSQTFYAYENQTVKETLQFVSRIKKSKEKSPDYDEDAFIRNLLSVLRLQNVQESYVGKLSGGERIRLSVGLELIGNPSLLFLDEPLSGLDSTNATKILEFLHGLAKAGKTLIVTIHQPSYKMIQFFDKIYLMAQGGLVFDGTCCDCIDFFAENGYPLPHHTNPTDHFLDTTAVDPEEEAESRRRIDSLKEAWIRRSKSYEITTDAPLGVVSDQNGCLRRPVFVDILRRNLVDIRRNTPYLKTKTLQRVVISALLSVTYWFVGKKSPVSVYSFRGILTFLVMNELFGICGPIFNIFKQEQRVILRERQSGFYSGYTVYLARFVSEMTVLLLLEIPYLTAVYVFTGFFDSFPRYIVFMLILVCEIMFGVSLGLTVSIVAPTANTAQALGATLSILFILYSAAFISPGDLPGWISWLIYLSPVHYAFRAAVQTQSQGKKFTFEESNSPVISSDELVTSFGLDGLNTPICIMMMIVFTTLMGVLGSVTLHYQTRNKIVS
ncbi:AB7G [Enterospora canceri]|uniref:AB7G n=1 Tax=Enterospora canceri TaxID=1081671 RepID=A0A1Y1S8V2_9MICR|nr:AB7G [Enterospora canceri]